MPSIPTSMNFDPANPPADEQERELMDEMMSLLQESQQGMPEMITPLMPAEPVQGISVVDSADELPSEFLDLLQESQNPSAFAGQTFVAEQASAAAPSASQCGEDLLAIFQRGGVDAISLMQYCVRSINLDPLFIALVREYQLRPSHQALLALYDCFCAPQAPCRLSLAEVLATHELRMKEQVAFVRAEWQQLQTPPAPLAEGESEPPRQRSTVPYRSIFDALLPALQQHEAGGWQRAQRSYNPQLSPNQNLPGGDMSMVQRHFVARVWQPVVRPRLVAAGFWRLSTVE